MRVSVQKVGNLWKQLLNCAKLKCINLTNLTFQVAKDKTWFKGKTLSRFKNSQKKIMKKNKIL